MNKELNLVTIGTLGRAHGIHGEINTRLTIDLPSILEYTESQKLFLFIEIDALPVPFLLESWRTKGEDVYLLKFEGIDSKEEAELYTNAPLLIESKFLNEETEFSATHFVGFTLLDQEERKIGTIVEVDDSTLNTLFVVLRENTEEVWIPIADELVQYIDIEQQVISLQIPEGLLD
ncbi:ribosome maturation factor RimM [Porphyromonas gingivicanis]|uniref:ribosome maturation factor RimM n=1 Tax=Porphyromonas gingivicanis TaxID=266762 RepID=UPI000470F5DF|nr:ribosome maturation factor RimM [Porphyromonas gingivicanis]